MATPFDDNTEKPKEPLQQNNFQASARIDAKNPQQAYNSWKDPSANTNYSQRPPNNQPPQNGYPMAYPPGQYVVPQPAPTNPSSTNPNPANLSSQSMRPPNPSLGYPVYLPQPPYTQPSVLHSWQAPPAYHYLGQNPNQTQSHGSVSSGAGAPGQALPPGQPSSTEPWSSVPFSHLHVPFDPEEREVEGKKRIHRDPFEDTIVVNDEEPATYKTEGGYKEPTETSTAATPSKVPPPINQNNQNNQNLSPFEESTFLQGEGMELIGNFGGRDDDQKEKIEELLTSLKEKEEENEKLKKDLSLAKKKLKAEEQKHEEELAQLEEDFNEELEKVLKDKKNLKNRISHLEQEIDEKKDEKDADSKKISELEYDLKILNKYKKDHQNKNRGIDGDYSDEDDYPGKRVKSKASSKKSNQITVLKPADDIPTDKDSNWYIQQIKQLQQQIKLKDGALEALGYSGN